MALRSTTKDLEAEETLRTENRKESRRVDGDDEEENINQIDQISDFIFYCQYMRDYNDFA